MYVSHILALSTTDETVQDEGSFESVKVANLINHNDDGQQNKYQNNSYRNCFVTNCDK